MRSLVLLQRSKAAFSLVEVTMALGITAFAIIPIFGLLSVGMSTNRSNIDRSIKAEILNWVQGDVRSRSSAYTANFDEFGITTSDAQSSSYLASVTLKTQLLPGGSLPLSTWDVVISQPSAANRKLDRNTLWTSP